MTILDAADSNPKEGGPSFSLKHRLVRVAWTLAWTLLAAWTPAPFHAWRRVLLRLFGARIAPGAHIYPSARIWYPPDLDMGPFSCLGPRVDCYSMAMISLGAYATVSQDAKLCAGSHDIADPNCQLVARPIVIGEQAWIAAGAFVGPGVTIGAGAVLGAQAVAFTDLPEWTVHIGNPAVFLKKRIIRAENPGTI
jgi:putative colanic acid biosynthesis acetyltransferase WcaF